MFRFCRIWCILVFAIKCFRFCLCICEGSWFDPSDPHNGTTLHQTFSNVAYNDSESISQFLKLSCPAEKFIYNCYYHRMIDRAEMLARRQYLATDPACIDYQPTLLLNMVRNKNLILIGDSTLLQTWQFIVCSLFNETEVLFDINWVHHQGGTNEVLNVFNQVTCPLNKQRCHTQAGVAKLPKENATIRFQWPPAFSFSVIEEYIKTFDLGQTDIVLMNFGLHFNDKAHFTRLAEVFQNDYMLKLNNTKESSSLPMLLWQQSFRTHFPTASGYFEGRLAGTCQPYKNETVAASQDWRNNVIDDILGGVLPIIRIAPALGSQWDAHIDSLSQITHYASPDCVHFCVQSGVLEFIARMMLNTIIRVQRTRAAKSMG